MKETCYPPPPREALISVDSRLYNRLDNRVALKEKKNGLCNKSPLVRLGFSITSKQCSNLSAIALFFFNKVKEYLKVQVPVIDYYFGGGGVRGYTRSTRELAIQL